MAPKKSGNVSWFSNEYGICGNCIYAIKRYCRVLLVLADRWWRDTISRFIFVYLFVILFTGGRLTDCSRKSTNVVCCSSVPTPAYSCCDARRGRSLFRRQYVMFLITVRTALGAPRPSPGHRHIIETYKQPTVVTKTTADVFGRSFVCKQPRCWGWAMQQNTN